MNRVWDPSPWTDRFDEMLDSENVLDTEDQWNLDFRDSQTHSISTEEETTGWKLYKHWATGRFRCSRCPRKWSSHNTVLSFRYRDRGGKGTVIMRPYGQACKRCQPANGFNLPGFSKGEVTGALRKLFEKIQRTCYGGDGDDDGGDDERRVARRHESALCQACREGICAGPVKTFDWVVGSAGYGQARDKARYVLTNLRVSSLQKRQQIETDTVGQHRNPLWSAYRKNRITSSNFGEVLAAVRRRSYPPSLFRKLRGEYDLSRVEAVQYGLHNEREAKQQYMRRTGMQIQERGVFLSDSGLLGASPDGTVSGGDRIVEVKCPPSAREMTIRQAAAQLRGFCLKLDDDGVLTLKPNHKYWHQIQGAMHLSGASSCDLVIWTPRHLEKLEVHKDPTWAENIGFLENFYRRDFLPHVLSQM